MSRSNPSTHISHPCTRWFEWKGEQGKIQYYDKNSKANVDVGNDFKFILLDQLSVVKGWHEPSESGITSNEVRDTKAETMVVRAFKGGLLAEGFYAQIRDRVKASGGRFNATLYIAYKDGPDLTLKLGALQIKGAALNAWVEFVKKNRDDLYKKGIYIKGSTEGKKGSVTFQVPNFRLIETNDATNAQAVELDKVLQEYLTNYFKRTRIEQVAQAPAPVGEEIQNSPREEIQNHPDAEPKPEPAEPIGDDVPF